jgi:hypothetical protein
VAFLSKKSAGVKKKLHPILPVQDEYLEKF